METKLHFFIGKGGVGKSTASAISSAHLSNISQDTLLVSMDPAHNQRDIFEKEFSENPRHVADHLMVKEVDADYWIQQYLIETEDYIKRTYMYQSAFNLQNYFNVLQFSPGLEEYALLLAFENVLHTANGQDVIIFDMPPTALTLRFFSLPFITLIWLEELLNLRNGIYEKKEIMFGNSRRSKCRKGGHTSGWRSGPAVGLLLTPDKRKATEFSTAIMEEKANNDKRRIANLVFMTSSLGSLSRLIA